MNRPAQRTRVYRLRPGSGKSTADAIAEFYELTAAEARVFSAIVDAGGVRSVAIALGISEATVKTHLQNIFGKTGVRRQIDLVKLVIAAASEPRRRFEMLPI